MAEYFTLFSVVLPLGTPENVTTARALYQSFGEELERIEGETIGFSIGKAPGNEPAAIWMHDDANGNPEHVIAFVRRCAETFKLEGRWGFCWGLTCSQPRCDGFGGGAHVLDLATGETVGWVDCETWLTSQLDLAHPPAQDGGAALQTSTISLEGAAAAEQVLREAGENRRAGMASEPSLARLINAEAAELTEVADALNTLIEHERAIALQPRPQT